MTIHLLRPAAGCDSLFSLSKRQKRFTARYDGQTVPLISTKRKPTRSDELKRGGSVYWIIKRVIQARQLILDAEIVETQNEGSRCFIYLDPQLVRTTPYPHKPFQGWRYLEPHKAPKDIGEYMGEDDSDIDPQMESELRELGLL